MGVGGQRHDPAVLPSGKRAGTHRTVGWVGSKAGLDGFGKTRSHQDSIPGPSKPVASHYTIYAVPALPPGKYPPEKPKEFSG